MPNVGATLKKDPEDRRLFGFDWTLLLGDLTITDSTYTIVPLTDEADDTLTMDEASILPGSQMTQVRLIGGTLGNLYRIENLVETSGSPDQAVEKSFKLKIKQG